VVKVLVVSRTPWRSDNSFGNSFSSILGGTTELEIHNIYCSAGSPDNSVVSSYLQLSESLIIKSILKGSPVGRRISLDASKNDNNIDELSASQKKGFAFFQRNRLQLFHWCRDLIWSRLNLNCDSFKRYIADVEPDLIFLPVYYSSYTNRIGLEIKRITGAPMVGYISDDNYTLRQFSLSPLYWIDRFIKRGYVKRAIDKCETLFVISDIQKQDYDIAFKKNCQILFKGAKFDVEPEKYHPKLNQACQFVFTGNIGDGRYQSLALLGKTLDELNNNTRLGELHIYTPTQLTRKMREALSCDSINLHAAVPFSQIQMIQKEADVLVHAESFQLKQRLQVRHSFSTKIVDYLAVGRAILGIGPLSTASIKYLADNNAAFIVHDKSRFKEVVLDIIKKPEARSEVIMNAWQCGQRNHQIEKIQVGLIQELTRVLPAHQTDVEI
jgi:hypothetical protein